MGVGVSNIQDKGVKRLRNGRIRVKTLNKLVALHNLSKEKKRLLTAQEVMEKIHCCRSHSYNYIRALKKLLYPMI
jgi:hypothetical protein